MFLLWQQWKYTYITLFQRIILLTFCCFDLNLIINWNVEDNFKFAALPSTYLVLILFVLGWWISFVLKKGFLRRRQSPLVLQLVSGESGWVGGGGVLDWWGWPRQRVRLKPFTLSLCLDSISSKQFHPLSTNKSYFPNHSLASVFFSKLGHRWIKAKLFNFYFREFYTVQKDIVKQNCLKAFEAQL